MSKEIEYYKSARDLYYQGNLTQKRITEIDELLRISIKLGPKLFAPHLYRGRLFYDISRYHFEKKKFDIAEKELDIAKEEFRKTLEINPKCDIVKYHLEELDRDKRCLFFPKHLNDVKKMTENRILLNHALLEWFENTIRNLIMETLERESMWDGISLGIGYKLRKTRQNCLNDERDLPLIYFVDFYQYANFIEKHKDILRPIVKNPEEWIHRLNELDHIRNSIRHSRGGYLSDETISKLGKWCEELQEIVDEVRKVREVGVDSLYQSKLRLKCSP